MKILIIRLSSFGDVILTQPIVAALQKHYPNSEISFVCKPEYQELAELFPPPLKVIPYKKTLSFHFWLRRQSFDLCVDLHSKFASWLLSFASGAKQSVCYIKQRRLRQRIVAGDKIISLDSTVDLYASVLRKLDIDPRWNNPALVFQQEDDKPNLMGNRRIAVFPGALHGTKRYPVQSYVELINQNKVYNWTLLGAKGDQAVCAAIKRQTDDHCTNKAGAMGIKELLSEVAKHDIIISGDSGPMHLAAALGKPQIAIFGGTHPSLGFRPLNPKAIVLCANLDCQPCSLHGLEVCPQKHFNCMKLITPQLISTQIDKLLSN